MKRARKLFLFNPYNLAKIETTYKELMAKTDLGLATLSSYKTKGYLLSRFNAYLVDEKTSIKELRDMASKVVIQDEIWKKVPGFPNLVSTYGRVKSERNNNFMIPFINYAGYLAIRFKRDNKNFTMPIHRLVAMVFLLRGEDERVFYFKYKNSEDYLFEKSSTDCVGHVNGKKFDNRACNLVWISVNDLHKIRKKKTVPVLKLDKETGKPLDFYESIESAADAHFICPNAIQRCLKGKSKTSAGFRWKIDTGEDIDFEEDDCLDEAEQYLSYC